MVKFTLSFSIWLLKYHRELYAPLMFGHLEEFTEELYQEYLEWCLTDEGKQYLRGGSKYREDEA